MMIKTFVWLAVSLIVFVLFWVIAGISFQPVGYPLSGPWTMDTEDGSEPIEPPFYRMIDQQQDFRISTSLSHADLKVMDTLMIIRPYCHGMKVWFNGREVMRLGDFRQRSANIWNAVIKVPLPHDLIQEDNELVLEMAGLYDIGLGGTPYLLSFEQALIRDRLFQFMDQEFYLIAIGGSMLIGLVLILVSLWVPDYKRVFLYIGLASFCAGIYLLDFQYRLSTGTLEQFLVFRKVILSSGYLSTFLLLLATEYLLFSTLKIAKYMFWATLGAIIILIAQRDIIALKQVANLANIVIMVNPMVATFWVLKKRFVPLVFPLCFLGWSIVHAILSLLTATNQPYLMGYGIMVCIISFGIFLVDAYKKTYQRMTKTHDKSLKDPLTQAFNRGILSERPFTQGDTLVMVDMDGFKRLNDTYGHEFGDQVLITLVNALTKNMRKTDFVIRYGGDEFLVLLHQCPKEKAFAIVHATHQELQDTFPDQGVSFSFGISQLGTDFNQALLQADKAMYLMKE